LVEGYRREAASKVPELEMLVKSTGRSFGIETPSGVVRTKRIAPRP